MRKHTLTSFLRKRTSECNICSQKNYKKEFLVRSHKDLDVYNFSLNLVDSIYNLTKVFPKEEIYGLTSQMRRSAISIPSNISEGAARKHRKEFIHFLYIASGSLAELETQIIIAKRQNYLNNEEIFEILKEVRKKLIGLIKSIEKNIKNNI